MLVPTAGPAFVPTPAQEEQQTETVTHSRPQTVEEPVSFYSSRAEFVAVEDCYFSRRYFANLIH